MQPSGRSSRSVAVAAVAGALSEAVVEATGQAHRTDPVLPRTGGPAGNALLTAWTAWVLLGLSLAELLTLVNVRGLISWHVAVGALLIPPAVLKTASTGWRMARYYRGNRPYQQAGPPPMLLRLLGPLVVVSTLGLLTTGALLIVIGEQSSRTSLVTVLGFRFDWITLHQGFFIVWCAAVGVHLLGRVVPAVRITFGGAAGPIPGTGMRVLMMAAMVGSAAALAVLLVHADRSWASVSTFDFRHQVPGR